MQKNYFKRSRRRNIKKKCMARIKYGIDFERGFETYPFFKNICNSSVATAKELIRFLVVVFVGSISLTLLTGANTEFEVYIWIYSLLLGLVAYIFISYFLKRTKKLDNLFYLTKKALKNNFINFQMKRGKCVCQK